MKHFEVIYFVGRHAFEYKCSTAREAFDALMDIGDNDHHTHIAENADRIMEVLVEMKNGSLISHGATNYSVRYVDGEV